jgi:hypothetical protein
VGGDDRIPDDDDLEGRQVLTMADRPPLETLPGRGRGLIESHLALLGADHLLLVRRSGYRERYRRIELADVEAWSLQPSGAANPPRLWLAVGALVSGFFALLAGGAYAVFWAVVTAVALASLGIHVARGPACRVHLRTPLDWIEIPAWRRLRPAERALARLTERVESVQGAISPVDGRRRLAEVSAPLASRPVANDRPAPAIAAAASGALGAPAKADTVWHRRLTWLLAGDLGLSLFRALRPAAAIDVAGALYLLFELGIAIAALFAQERSELPRALRRWTVGAVVGLAASFAVAAYVATFAAAFSGSAPQSPFAPVGVPDLVRVGMASGSVAVAGFLLVWRLRTTRAAAERG